MPPEIIIRTQGNAGRITLNRPATLNALSYEMVLEIENALIKWRDDTKIKLIIIDAAGNKAFCAGGDIQKLYDTGIKGEFDFMRKFWADEYRLNAMISNYPKPFVALMDGIVMGGGVGVSAHGSHRIVTERTMLAMPECAIGLVPDVGGSMLLARSPGHIGEWMGGTGARLGAADAIYTRFADHFVPGEDIPKLISALITSGDASIISSFSKNPGISGVQQNAELIEKYFSLASIKDTVKSLEESDGEWQKAQVKSIRRSCPLSIACSWQMVRDARTMKTIEEALINEYRFVWRSMEEGDVLEGVRALIIDKDRKPQWKVKKLELVTKDMVSSMLASLGENELNLKSLQEN